MNIKFGLFLIIPVILTLISACGGSSSNSDTTDDSSATKPGESVNYCGYKFDKESESETNTLLSSLQGQWIDNSTGFTTEKTDGKDYAKKSGMEFDVFSDKYGAIKFLTTDIINPVYEIKWSSTQYNEVWISKVLKDVKFASDLTGDFPIRAIELRITGAAPSWKSCVTYLYKVLDSKNIVVTYSGYTSYVSGNGTIPSIDEVVAKKPGVIKYKKY